MSIELFPFLDAVPEPTVVPGVLNYTVSYNSGDYRVKAALAIPEGGQAKQLPALLYCRGGIRGVGKVRPERIAQFAAFGYVVLAPHYRGNEGGEGRDEFGGAEREDVYAAYELLRALPFVDPVRVSLYGFSRGGIMALFAAMECPNVLAAVVWGGVSDMLLTYEERVDLRRMLRRVIGHPKKDREAYLDRTPLYRVNEINCPVLIIHGLDDQNVGIEHAKRLAQALTEHNKPFELWLVEEASHLFKSDEIELYTKRMIAWLDKMGGIKRASVESEAKS